MALTYTTGDYVRHSLRFAKMRKHKTFFLPRSKAVFMDASFNRPSSKSKKGKTKRSGLGKKNSNLKKAKEIADGQVLQT